MCIHMENLWLVINVYPDYPAGAYVQYAYSNNFVPAWSGDVLCSAFFKVLLSDKTMHTVRAQL